MSEYGVNIGQDIVRLSATEAVDFAKIDGCTEEMENLVNGMDDLNQFLSKAAALTCKEDSKRLDCRGPEMQELITKILVRFPQLQSAFDNSDPKKSFYYKDNQITHLNKAINNFINNVVGPELKIQSNKINRHLENMNKKTDTISEMLKDHRRLFDLINRHMSQNG